MASASGTTQGWEARDLLAFSFSVRLISDPESYLEVSALVVTFFDFRLLACAAVQVILLPYK